MKKVLAGQLRHPDRAATAGSAAGAAYCVVVLLATLLLITPAGAQKRKNKKQKGEPPKVEDFMVVDCLLPGKVRSLGRRSTYLTPRRPTRTTALDCRIRGGEYTSFDRANYSTAISVWLGEAKAGSSEAQFYLGQIHEKGLGVDPDFSAAAQWYRKAAEQGHSSAQTSLAYLYEMGLGVEQDAAEALQWYRKASGLPDEMVVLEAEQYDDLLALQAQLDSARQELDDREQDVTTLQEQLQQLERELDDARRDTGDTEKLEGEVQALRQRLRDRETSIAEYESRVDDLEERLSGLPPATPGSDFGPYEALVIGIRDYQHLEALEGAHEAAREIAAVLERRYGFRVRLLLDPSRYDILSAFNELREELTEKHNLVVYFVGHSVRDAETRRSWWQPTDAEPDIRANWLSTGVLNDNLDLIPARHILVLADAAYSGILTRSAIPRLPTGMSEERRREYVEQLLEKRSRLVLTSGAGPSPFTDLVVELLRENDHVLEASALHRWLTAKLPERGVDRAPEYAPLRFTRTEGGSEFFFVPANDSASLLPR
jgi:hypothetical protein